MDHVLALEHEVLLRGGGALVFIPGKGFSVARHFPIPQDQAAIWELFLAGVALKAQSSLKFVSDMVEEAERAMGVSNDLDPRPDQDPRESTKKN